MRFNIFRSGVFCLAVASAVAAQAETTPRAPAAGWVVNFDDAQCIAHRDYGTGRNPPRLLLKAPPLGDVMQVAILRDAVWREAEQADATIAVGEDPPVKTSLMMYSPAPSRQRVYLLNMASAEFAKVRRAKTLSVRSTGLNETFTLGQMEPLMKVMDECVADLRRVFNVSAKGTEPAGLRSRAKGDLAKFFSSDDYPVAAVRKGLTGRVEFALLILEDGRVADCTIVATSGVPSLDSQACALLKVRAKFEPARDHAGKGAKDSGLGAIVWQIPKK